MINDWKMDKIALRTTLNKAEILHWTFFKIQGNVAPSQLSKLDNVLWRYIFFCIYSFSWTTQCVCICNAIVCLFSMNTRWIILVV